eukprot:3080355-Lingulodinium_polyedra.AAC.1
MSSSTCHLPTPSIAAVRPSPCCGPRGARAVMPCTCTLRHSYRLRIVTASVLAAGLCSTCATPNARAAPWRNRASRPWIARCRG